MKLERAECIRTLHYRGYRLRICLMDGTKYVPVIDLARGLQMGRSSLVEWASENTDCVGATIYNERNGRLLLAGEDATRKILSEDWCNDDFKVWASSNLLPELARPIEVHMQKTTIDLDDCSPDELIVVIAQALKRLRGHLN